MNEDDFVIVVSQHLCNDLFPSILFEWFIVVFDDEIMVGLNYLEFLLAILWLVTGWNQNDAKDWYIRENKTWNRNRLAMQLANNQRRFCSKLSETMYHYQKVSQTTNRNEQRQVRCLSHSSNRLQYLLVTRMEPIAAKVTRDIPCENPPQGIDMDIRKRAVSTRRV